MRGFFLFFLPVSVSSSGSAWISSVFIMADLLLCLVPSRIQTSPVSFILFHYSSPLEQEASACLNCVCPIGYSAVPNLTGLLCGCVRHQVKRTEVEGGHAVS